MWEKIKPSTHNIPGSYPLDSLCICPVSMTDNIVPQSRYSENKDGLFWLIVLSQSQRATASNSFLVAVRVLRWLWAAHGKIPGVH